MSINPKKEADQRSPFIFSEDDTVLNSPGTPQELKKLIVSFLDTKSAEALSLTNRNFHTLISHSKPIQTASLKEFSQKHLLKAKQKVQEVKQQAKDISPLIPTVQILIDAAKAEIQIGAIKEAKKTLYAAEDIASAILEHHDSIKFQAQRELIEIAKIQAQIGATKDAKEILQLSEEGFNLALPYHRFQAYIKTAEFHFQTGATEEAKKNLLLAKQEAGCSLQLAEIAKLQAQIETIEEAKKTLVEAKEKAHMWIDEFEALIAIGKAEAQIGAIEDAKKTLGLAEKTLRTDVASRALQLISIAEVQTQIKAIEDLKKTLGLAEKAALLIKNTSPYRSTTLAQIAGIQAQIGAIDDAKKTLKLAEEAIAYIENYIHQSQALRDIGEAQSTIDAMEIETQAKEGNIGAVKNYLHKTPHIDAKDHLNIAQRALKLVDIVLQSPIYTD